MNDRPLSETEIKIFFDFINIFFGQGSQQPATKENTKKKVTNHYGRHFEINKTITKQINNKNIFTTKIIIN